MAIKNQSSTVVTGSAAIQKRIEAICSKLRQSKPTEKTLVLSPKVQGRRDRNFPEKEEVLYETLQLATDSEESLAQHRMPLLLPVSPPMSENDQSRHQKLRHPPGFCLAIPS